MQLYLVQQTLYDHIRLFILGGLSSEYVIIQGNGSQALPDVSCESHEEEDAHLAVCNTTAVIQATDTDIMVIAIYHGVRIPGLEKLWVHTLSPDCETAG